MKHHSFIWIVGRVGYADWLVLWSLIFNFGEKTHYKINEGHHSSVTDDFLDFRTRSLMDKDSSWSSFRVALVTSCCSLSSSSADRSSFCPLFLFWLTNCCTTKPWYFTRRACWSCQKKEEPVTKHIRFSVTRQRRFAWTVQTESLIFMRQWSC